MSRRLVFGLGATFLVLGAALAFGAVFPGLTDPDGSRPAVGAISLEAAASPPAVPAPSGNPLWGVPLKDLSATRERPLFSPGRRPPSPPAVYAVAAVAKPIEPDRPQLTLVGTIAGGSAGYGIFIDKTTSKVARLKTGESHNGWTLRRVTRREIVLEKNDESIVLGLPAANVPAASGTQAVAESKGRMPRQ